MKRLTSLTAAVLVLTVGVSTTKAANWYLDQNDDVAGSGVASQVYNWTLDGSGLAPAFWNTNNADGTQASPGLNTSLWVNGNDAVFSAGTDATGIQYGVNIGTGVTATSATVEEGQLQLSAGVLDTGTGIVNVNSGATLEMASSARLNSGGKIVLNGGQILQTNPGNAGSFVPSGKAIEINGTGIVNYTSSGTGTVSIYTTTASTGFLGTGGTPANGGAGTLIKRGPNEVRYQGPGLPFTSYAKLRVEQGLFRLGFNTVDVEERGFGAVPLAPLADAITLDGGNIAHSFNTTTLHVNRGITVTANGGAWAGGNLNVPSLLTGNGVTLGITSGAFALQNAGNAATWVNSKFAATAGTIASNADAAFGQVPGSVVPDYFTLGNGGTGNGTVRGDATMTLDSNRGITVTGTTGGGQLSTLNSGVTVTYNGVITGTGNLIKTGAGTWVLGGTNNYTGITTSFGGGVLSISSEANIGGAPASPTATGLTLAGATTGGTLRTTSSISLSPNRGVFLNPGQSVAADPNTAVGGTLDVTTGNTLTVPGVISGAAAVGTTGAGRLTKSGDGTLIVTNDNTYTGSTTVSGGTLLVNNTTGSGTGTGAVTVAAAGTLGGTGTIAGAITNNGTLAPGSGGVGTLSTTGNFTNGAGAIWNIDLSGATADKLAVTGNIDLTAADTLNVLGSGTGTSWLIGTYTGTLSGVFDTITSGYTVSYTGGNITLNVGVAGLPGDFNSDGKVDAGDYVTWRKNDGTNNALANDNGLGVPVGANHYNLWRANFGNPPGAGSGLSGGAAVPEPTSAALLIFCVVSCCGFCRRRPR